MRDGMKVTKRQSDRHIRLICKVHLVHFSCMIWGDAFASWNLNTGMNFKNLWRVGAVSVLALHFYMAMSLANHGWVMHLGASGITRGGWGRHLAWAPSWEALELLPTPMQTMSCEHTHGRSSKTVPGCCCFKSNNQDGQIVQQLSWGLFRSSWHEYYCCPLHPFSQNHAPLPGSWNHVLLPTHRVCPEHQLCLLHHCLALWLAAVHVESHDFKWLQGWSGGSDSSAGALCLATPEVGCTSSHSTLP